MHVGARDQRGCGRIGIECVFEAAAGLLVGPAHGADQRRKRRLLVAELGVETRVGGLLLVVRFTQRRLLLLKGGDLAADPLQLRPRAKDDDAQQRGGGCDREPGNAGRFAHGARLAPLDGFDEGDALVGRELRRRS